jgi:hypothetical protein
MTGNDKNYTFDHLCFLTGIILNKVKSVIFNFVRLIYVGHCYWGQRFIFS